MSSGRPGCRATVRSRSRSVLTACSAGRRGRPARWMSRSARPAAGSSSAPRSGGAASPATSCGATVSMRSSTQSAATSSRSSVGPPSHRIARAPRSVHRCSRIAGIVSWPGSKRCTATQAPWLGTSPVGLGVDLHARGRLGQQRDVAGQVQAARDRGDDRLGLEPGRGAVRALVVVEQVGVALGAQRPGADEDRVDGGAQLAQQRAVGRVAEPDRAPLTAMRPSAEAIIAATTRGRRAVGALAQAEPTHDLARRPAGAGVGQRPQPGVGHARIMPRRPPWWPLSAAAGAARARRRRPPRRPCARRRRGRWSPGGGRRGRGRWLARAPAVRALAADCAGRGRRGRVRARRCVVAAGGVVAAGTAPCSRARCSRRGRPRRRELSAVTARGDRGGRAGAGGGGGALRAPGGRAPAGLRFGRAAGRGGAAARGAGVPLGSGADGARWTARTGTKATRCACGGSRASGARGALLRSPPGAGAARAARARRAGSSRRRAAARRRDTGRAGAATPRTVSASAAQARRAGSRRAARRTASAAA